jgi:hypothetical protein
VSDLDTVAEHKAAWYRLIGTTSADGALAENSESADDVAYLFLTRGYRAAQAWLISEGMGERWRKRSSAITSWSGTDAADGGRYKEITSAGGIATDFLRPDSMRADGASPGRSALVEADGDPWGCEVEADQDYVKGDYYYLSADRLWLARTANVPSTVYFRYYYAHPAITSGTTSFDMPVALRWLSVAEAADAAANEGWLPGGTEQLSKIDRALGKARADARAQRRTRSPRRFKPPAKHASHW